MPKVVLVIDDSPEDAEVLVRVLQGPYGATLRALHIASPAAALTWLTQHAADLVLLDMRMPELDGLEVLHQLKDDDRTRAVPVVVVSGTLLPGDAERCREGGAELVLLKEYASEAFARTVLSGVRQWLGDPPSGAPPTSR